MKWISCSSYEDLSRRAADMLLHTIREDPHAVVGLPTGRTPVGMYERVVHECSREYHCFRDVHTFNLDEYIGISRGHPGSYFSYMKKHLFDHVDISPDNAHIPDGTAADLGLECARYEDAIRRAGGLQVTFLGLGRNGHIGFNEPGTPFASRTRVVDLHESTRLANADLFGGGQVPTRAITMGIATILESRAIVLLAGGSGKEDAIKRLQSRIIDESFPASVLWRHDNVTVLAAV